jgi:peroxin-2
MLREQFLRAFALFRPAAIVRLMPELTLLLDFLVSWLLPHQNSQASYLAGLQDRATASCRTLVVPGLLPPLPQIFRFSIWEGRPLPGMSLMNLRYRNEGAVQAAACGSSSSSSSGHVGAAQACLPGGRSGVEGPGLSAAQRTLYCLGAVVLRYAWARLTHHAAAAHWGDMAGAAWRRHAWTLLRRAESCYRIASLANFLAFLRTGRYRCGGARS